MPALPGLDHINNTLSTTITLRAQKFSLIINKLYGLTYWIQFTLVFFLRCQIGYFHQCPKNYGVISVALAHRKP